MPGPAPSAAPGSTWPPTHAVLPAGGGGPQDGKPMGPRLAGPQGERLWGGDPDNIQDIQEVLRAKPLLLQTDLLALSSK